MNWEDIDFHPPARTLRQFAGLWLIVFAALAGAAFRAHRGSEFVVALLATGVVVGVSGLLVPKVIRPLFVALIVAGFPIGYVVSRSVLMIVFFLMLTPLGLAFRMTGRDTLERKKSERASYWKPKEKQEDVETYLHQF